MWTSSFAPQYTSGFNVSTALATAVSPATGRVFQTGVIAGSPSNLYATAAYDEATGVLLWTAYFASPNVGDAESLAIAVSPDGSKVFVTGRDNWYFTSSDVGTVAYDAATGQQLWADTLDIGPADAGLAIGVSADGSRVYVGGASFTGQQGGNYGFLTVAYNTNSGQRIWQNSYVGAGQLSDGIRLGCLVVDPATDRVFVAGHSANANLNDDFAVVAYDGTSGQQLWVARWSGGDSAESLPDAIAISPDGSHVFVTGYSDEGSAGEWSDYVTVALNAATGTQEWVSHYEGPTRGSASATSIAVSPDANKVFVTGQIPGPIAAATCVNQCDDQYGTVAYDTTNGNQLWTNVYGTDYPYSTGSVSQGATGVAVSGDSGTVYVTGVAYNGGGTFAAATLGLDSASGTQKWLGRYIPTLTGVDTAVPTQVVIDRANGQVLVGSLFEHEDAQSAGPESEYGLIAYTGDGLIRAVSRKAHGSAGTFDVDLPIAGPSGIECRTGGTNGDYSLVFTFANTLTSVGGAHVATGNGSVPNNTGSIDGNDAHNYIVNLTGVTDAQTVTVALSNAAESTGDTNTLVSASMKILIGDVNATSLVDSGDVFLVRQQTGQTANSSNFREDVNASGLIDSGDVFLTRQKTGTSLAP